MSAQTFDEITYLLDCPAASLKWAAVGCRLGMRYGAENVARQLGQDGIAAAKLARNVMRRTPWAEIVERQRIDFKPCAARCGRCSRCVCAEARERRGGRDYLGIEREAELANRANRGAA